MEGPGFQVRGKQETPEEIRNKTQYFLLRNSNRITWRCLQPEESTVTPTTVIDLPIETVEKQFYYVQLSISSKLRNMQVDNCKAAEIRDRIYIYLVLDLGPDYIFKRPWPATGY